MRTLFRKILVPHDLSEHASRALALAAELARVHRGELTVLHVIAPYQPVLGFPEGVTWNLREEDIITSARRSLEEMVARALKGARAPRTARAAGWCSATLFSASSPRLVRRTRSSSPPPGEPASRTC